MQEPSSVNSPASRIETDRSGVRIPPPLIYIAGFLVGIALEVAFPIAALPLALALVAALVGIVIWLALDGAAMLHFQRARTSMVPMRPSTALVTSGPYRFTRNPMYLGMAVLYAALALALGVIWALAVLPLVILAVNRLVIAREEPYLERKFGDQYQQYRGGFVAGCERSRTCQSRSHGLRQWYS